MISPVIAQLEKLIDHKESSGPIADADARLDTLIHSKSDYEYARLRNGSELSGRGSSNDNTFGKASNTQSSAR